MYIYPSPMMQAVDPSTTTGVPAMEEQRNHLASVALLGAVAVLTLCYWYFFKSTNQESPAAVCRLTEEERRTLAAKRLKILENNVKEDDVLPSKKRSEDLKKRSPRQRVVSDESEVSSSGGSITATTEKAKCVQQLNEAETVRQPITGEVANPFENVLAQVRPGELVHTTTSPVTEQRPVSVMPKSNARCLVERLMESENDQEANQVGVSSQRQQDHTVGELVPLEASPSAGKRSVSRDKGESEISSNESIQDPPPQKMKPKRKKILLSPPQVICEALSHVFKCRFTAEPKGDAGTWSGEGWVKRRSDYPNAIMITLPLYKFRPPSMENEWTALCAAFPKVLDSSSLSPKLLQNNIRKVIVSHSRANDMARKGFTLVMKGDEGWSEIRSCIEAVSHWLAKQVAFWIRPEAEAARTAVHYDEDEVSDLFSNDYNTEGTPLSESCHTGPFESLFELLEETVCVVTGEFMEDLFCVYMEKSTQDDQHLPQVFLFQMLNRLATAKKSNSFSSPTLTNRIMAISNLLTLSSSVGLALVSSVRGELEQVEGKNGRDIQGLVRLAPLIEAAAYAVPAAGTERQPGPRKGGFLQQLESVQDFPVCVFLPKGGGETGRVMEEARRTMKAARQTAELSLRVVFRIGGKEQTFQWLANIIRSNEPLVNLLKSNLLESDGVIGLSSTRDFLLGLTSTLVAFCHTSLGERFEKMGADAFDAAYLCKAFHQADEMNRLFQGPVRKYEELRATPNYDFSGSTHFFFLSCLIMRVALHPALRMDREFHERYNQLLNALRGEANSENASQSRSFKSASPVVAAWLGWKSFLEDPGFASNTTDLTLIQLGWLVAIARKGGPSLSLIPDWMCREPAHWMSHLAYTSPFWLKPRQAEKAVEYATALLDLATSSSASGERSFFFSPIVVTSLIQIILSFVQAGVARARSKQQRRLRPGFGIQTGDDEHEQGDDRDLDVYSSFDQNDLGVTVFTNRIVQETLCPVLIRTFHAVDVVEGFDADRDDTFDKFSAKSQIAELMLRLWAHPSGECRKSVAFLSTAEILRFASSLATAAGVVLDFGFGSLQKVHISAKGRLSHTMGGIERAFVEQQASSAVGQLLGVRRFLRLLCALSEDGRIASYLGGYAVDMTMNARFLFNLSSMIIHFLEKMTSRDGGTNQSLEDGSCEPTSNVAAHLGRLSIAEKTPLVEDLIRRRIRVKAEYGLDVGVLCHQLLALATKWHLTAIKLSNDQTRVSAFLAVLAEHEDCDLVRLENVFKRLVTVPSCTEGSEVNNASSIFEHDGYVDHATWEHKYIDASVSEVQKGHRRTARQDQMKRTDIAKIANNDEISLFLDDLRRAITNVEGRKEKSVGREEIAVIQESILSSGGSLAEDGYGESLSDWVVSSAPFRLGEDVTAFSHSYGKVVRSHDSINTGAKTLANEARKCVKSLPLPTASSAIYVCFAEERMDLCRVVMSGPVDTPYAHGLFEFDVYFPPTYPQIPPLVTFMTTGGGQVRFNPNLYVDGKVCISLLGVTNASDESQRWNPGGQSSLAQLMLSIQSQILGVQEPYFNEGNGVPESMKLTPAGREGSTKYNNIVRLATMRYAMVGHLRNPPKGFEEVTSRHFSMCRRRIVVQARLWMWDARNTHLYDRYERAYAELMSLLGTESMKKYKSLAPLPEEMKRLEMIDPSLFYSVDNSDEGDRKPSASESVRERPVPSAFNPWAAGQTTTSNRAAAVCAPNSTLGSKTMQDDDSDDELYT